ncbi:PREDICTED: zinc finger MYM-type protein 1-like [Prunus mume]|uniref:Zinc finger MYM-type protein 1-like n=1 Tax=Prunus mume TaxID=102107 RepID=A0ABM1LHQ2_PRUMU|nr:PREDICTED: zinc finger MYM-type protein 1-like [Prunus mume]
MVDEACDVSIKEQMAIVLRYVNDKGQIIERFVRVQHVTDTTSSVLKEAIDEFFSSANLSFSKLRRQGYDGASNMRGEFNGLKTKILREQPCAFYVHCFARQLQLALVVVAKKNVDVNSFFTTANSLVNVVEASCKRRDALRAQYQEELVRAFEEDCLITGRGLNQETTLKRARDTRWNSHYAILGITNTLSLALQKKDQDIVSAMSLVTTCKENLQFMRDNEFEELVEQASLFCYKHDITVPTINEEYVIPGRLRCHAPMKTNYHRYRVEIFIHVIDGQLAELNDRFNEVSTELLTCLACLCPKINFVAFDKRKLVRLAQFYPDDFSDRDLLMLEDQLGVYVHHMRSSIDFSQLEGISSLAEKMVEKGMHEIFPYVYLHFTLALVLPVATTSVERVFSAMNIIKNQLRNRMGDQWLNNSLIVYIERDVFACIDNETIMQRFQNMKTRRGQL